MPPLFEHYGVQLWMPEAGGLVDFQAEGHEAMMTALGIQSKREITRTRIRVRTAMAAQTREQGRYLGGRPPYGYRWKPSSSRPFTLCARGIEQIVDSTARAGDKLEASTFPSRSTCSTAR